MKKKKDMPLFIVVECDCMRLRTASGRGNRQVGGLRRQGRFRKVAFEVKAINLTNSDFFPAPLGRKHRSGVHGTRWWPPQSCSVVHPGTLVQRSVDKETGRVLPRTWPSAELLKIAPRAGGPQGAVRNKVETVLSANSG